ncbi:MAG: hypothetical protein IPO19_09310 [Rhodoferax sp.]|nr:hypothetical protein [Rhodoferax sp.]
MAAASTVELMALGSLRARPATSSNGALPVARNTSRTGSNSSAACRSATGTPAPEVASTRNQRTDASPRATGALVLG